MADLATEIVAEFGALATYVPVIVAGAIGIALFFWGVPKLISLFKRVAS